MLANGSPGMLRIRKNVTVTTKNSVISMYKTRLRMYFGKRDLLL